MTRSTAQTLGGRVYDHPDGRAQFSFHGLLQMRERRISQPLSLHASSRELVGGRACGSSTCASHGKQYTPGCEADVTSRHTPPALKAADQT